MSKVISRLLWFCFTAFCDWLPKFAPLSQPMRSKTKTNRASLAPRFFPRLAPVIMGFMYLLRILIGPLCCLRFLFFFHWSEKLLWLTLWLWFYDTQLPLYLLVSTRGVIGQFCGPYFTARPTRFLSRATD